MSKLVVALATLLVALPGSSLAQERLFPRGVESGVVNGGLTAIGGTNGGFTIPLQDVDGVAATTDSSSEVLTLPAGAEVLHASLVWNQDCITPCTMSGVNAIDASRADGARAVIVLPDGTTTTVASQGTGNYGTVASQFTVTGRWARADVTSLVTTQMAGRTSARFAVGNIHPTVTVSGSGHFRNATWSIFVAYRLASAPLRALAIDFHAAPLPAQDGATERTLTIGGIQLPTVGPVSGDVIVYTADGQASLSVQERIFIDTKADAKALSNAANPDNGVWNHSISYRGTHSTTALPDPRNFNAGAAGIDLDVFDISGKPTPGATSTKLIATTTPAGQPNQEYVIIMALGLAVDVQQPELVLDKRLDGVRTAAGEADPSGIADAGELIDYVVTVENVGNDAAANVVLHDLPEGQAFVPGSLVIGGSPSDADPTAGVALGDLAVGASLDVRFTLRALAPTLGATLVDVARVEYDGTSGGGRGFSAESEPVVVPWCGNALSEGEACDDGNELDADACRNDCSLNEGPEVCDDGLDNDADGLVDAYDADCETLPTCTAEAGVPGFSVKQAWVSSFALGAMTSVVIGDLDGDQRPEVVALKTHSNDDDYSTTGYVIVSGAGTANATTREALVNGTITTERIAGGSAAALGELDPDSPGAEIVAFSRTGRLYLFAATGALLATSAPIAATIPDRTIGDNATAPMIADLDHDGRPEIIAGNAVVGVNAGEPGVADTTLPVLIGLDATLPRGNVPNGNYPAIADLLSVADCGAICDGLELAAGGTVYAFDLAAKTRVAVRRLSEVNAAIPAAIDGPTAVADMDADGDLDVVFNDTSGTGSRDMYVWDPRQETLGYRATGVTKAGSGSCWGSNSAATRSLSGALTIAEVYDERVVDGKTVNLPEVLFTTINAVRAYNPQLGRVWELAHSDCSAVTGITAFDFNGDGIREVVLNDEQALRIVYGGPVPLPDGVDSNRNWARFAPSGTSTLTEHPVVADVDADGQAEIVAVTAGSGAAINGVMRIFETNGAPWRPTRGVWNQRGYSPSMVGDDLQIPRFPQDRLAELPAGSGRTPLDLYNAQAPALSDQLLPPPLVAAADLEVVEVTVTSADPETGISRCGQPDHWVALAIEVENKGAAPLLAGAPIKVYRDDPALPLASPIAVGATNGPVAPGARATFTISALDPNTTAPSYPLYVVVNEGGAGECVYDDANRGLATVVCSECGNGLVEAVNEGCDDGAANGTTVCGCTATCTKVADGTSCDDGRFCTGVEVCLAGLCQNTEVPCGEPGEVCQEDRERCYIPVCGNGTVDEGEACDDGNRVDADPCGNDCQQNTLAEACEDGVDNDGDGLVDAWDGDCAGDAPSCTVAAAIPGFSVRESWASATQYGALQPLAVGDLDGHGSPEVVAAAGTLDASDYAYTAMAIVSHAGSAAVTERGLALPSGEKVFGGAPPALGDLFAGSPGGEIMVLGASGRLHVYSATGALLTSSPPIHPSIGARFLGDAIAAPNLADLDMDGVPEVVLGNAVLKVAGDALTVAIPLDKTLPRGNAPSGNHVALVDLLSPEDCDDAICQGLELVAGGTVYALDLAKNERRVVRRLADIAGGLPVDIDGPTAVADLNGDGSLDVVFGDTRDGNVARDLYLWDPRLGVLHSRFAQALKAGACGGNTSASTRAIMGAITIADVYDDRADGDARDMPEILFGTVNAVRAYHYNWGRRWELTHADCSGSTGVTAFDFNGDGTREVVLNDEQRLRIVYGGALPFPAGVDAARNWATFSPSGTATLNEHPIVVDVDADGAAEIVAVTGNAALATRGALRVFESASEPWRPARTVWNQPGYRAVNIGEDLRVPAVMQGSLVELPAGSGQRPLNVFNAQPPAPADLLLPPGIVAAADLEVVSATLTSADPVTGVSPCGQPDHVFALRVVVANTGDAALPAGAPVALYAGDPFAGAPALVGRDVTAAAIEAGATVELEVAVAEPLDVPGLTATTFSLYVVVNDDGEGPWPLATGAAAGECTRDRDNLGVVEVVCNACGNGLVELNEACDPGDATGFTTCGCQPDCSLPEVGAACSDGDACTVGDACDGAGECAAGADPCPDGEACVVRGEGFVCSTCMEDADCGDVAKTCHRWACGEDLRCAEVPTPGVSCADADWCDGAEVCDAAGACAAGVAPCVGDDVCVEAAEACVDPCGNGVVAGAEACDDGDREGGDGCSASCELEHGYCRPGTLGCAPCVGDCAAVVAVCGDGRVAAGDADGDGEADEVCDDGDDDAGDGCDACRVGCGWACTTAAPAAGQGVESPQTSGCETTCGDGVKAGAEGCDDGGVDGGDGCSAECGVEGGWLCAEPAGEVCAGASLCSEACGNGVLDEGEACDAGESNGATTCGCQAGCRYAAATVACEDGLACNGEDRCDGAGACGHAGSPCEGQACLEVGDGFVCDPCVDDEACADAEPCTAERCVEGRCVSEPAAGACGDDSFCNGAGACVGGACVEPGDPCDAETEKCDEVNDRCVARCGDGVLDEGEGCDDANTANEDGCSASCEVEPGCYSDDACASPTPVCDLADHTCVECTEDGDCGDGLVCSEARVCVAEVVDGVVAEGGGSCAGGATGWGVLGLLALGLRRRRGRGITTDRFPS